MKGVDWLRTLLSGEPHFIIGGPENPYLKRWFLVPRNRFFNVYLHQFLHSDDDRAEHDHPWKSLSICLAGQLEEVTGDLRQNVRRGSVRYRKATHRHRLILESHTAWTLFFTGPVVRSWGFWCPQGFVPWEKFTASGDRGQVGRGCDQ